MTTFKFTASRSNDVVSTKKKRKAEGATSSSSKGKGRKVVQDEPSLKKKKVNDEALADDDEDVAIDTNAMQTRIRTGTISKVHTQLDNYCNNYYNYALEYAGTFVR